MRMNDYVMIFCSSLLLGVGLEISQMTDPNKVIGFLNIFEKWDPSLAFVMCGAIFVNSIFYFLIKRKEKPIPKNSTFEIPTHSALDQKLIVGSGLFGVGWSVAGFCPAPLLANIFNFQHEIFMAIGSMFIGFYIHHKMFLKKT
jgi:uncharacterized protein